MDAIERVEGATVASGDPCEQRLIVGVGPLLFHHVSACFRVLIKYRQRIRTGVGPALTPSCRMSMTRRFTIIERCL